MTKNKPGIYTNYLDKKTSGKNKRKVQQHFSACLTLVVFHQHQNGKHQRQRCEFHKQRM